MSRQETPDLGHVCEHCGAPWMTDSRLYNDGCCAKDQMAQDRRECPEIES